MIDRNRLLLQTLLAGAIVLGATPCRAEKYAAQTIADVIDYDAPDMVPTDDPDWPRIPAQIKDLPGSLDSLMSSLLTAYKVPGGALAIGYKGKLVFARGYGYADLANQRPFTPETIFCLASISKTLTSVAILKLAEAGKLSLDETLYEILDRPDLGSDLADPNVKKITVRQMLHHSGGWSRDVIYEKKLLDQLTLNGPVPVEKYLQAIMRQPLDYVPGSQSKYSNFQFNTLKTVVERASGMPYDKYVQITVLNPLGITDMAIEPLEGHYLDGEAHRYDCKTLTPFPGGRGESQIIAPLGSWEASVKDLVRLLMAIDGSRAPRLLSRESRTAMLAPPPPPMTPRQNGTYFGLGWDKVKPASEIEAAQYSKNGAINGVRTLIEHLPGNIDVAMFFNGSGYDSKSQSEGKPSMFALATRRLNTILSRTTKWPGRDLYSD